MSGGAKLGVEAFSYGLDKGYDRIPNSIFLTPKERKQRKQQERQQQQVGQQYSAGVGAGAAQGPDSFGQSQQPPPQQGQFYSQSSQGYGQDSYAQDRSRDQGYGGQQQEDARQIDDQPFWNQDGRSSQGTPMQGDGYYGGGGGGGRRSYNPSDYEPRYNGYDDGYGMNAGRDPYGRSASAGRVDRYRPQSYDDGYDSYDDEYDRRDSRRDRRQSKSKSRRSGSRSGGIRGKLDKTFDKTEQGLTSGALGALAGGLVGHEVGKGPLATVAGVVLGGLGANAFEARHERHKSERETSAYGKRRSKSTDAKGGGYEEEYYRKDRKRGGNRDYDDYDSYDDEDSSPRRLTGSERKERRRANRDKDETKEEMEKHFGWGNTLRS